MEMTNYIGLGLVPHIQGSVTGRYVTASDKVAASPLPVRDRFDQTLSNILRQIIMSGESSTARKGKGGGTSVPAYELPWLAIFPSITILARPETDFLSLKGLKSTVQLSSTILWAIMKRLNA